MALQEAAQARRGSHTRVHPAEAIASLSEKTFRKDVG
jgi:hypothetical protein